MTDPAGSMPRTIRARIHPSAVRRVTRIYAATLADIFAELLQNSRRAGATHIRIAVSRSGAPPAAASPAAGESRATVTLADDGAGIADPALLLSFGQNGWSDELVRREDAAGFGFASLARRGCAVASRPRSPDGGLQPGWTVELAPAHFLGEEEARIFPGDRAPHPHGTSISFRTAESLATIRDAAAIAARHYPLRILFENRIDGETAGPEDLPRRAFLDGAVHAECWRGLAFGVFRHCRHACNNPDLNFHGLTLPVRLPTVETVHGDTWTVRADIHDCPDLELVLPARKEAVENGFLKEMRAAARLAIYRAMEAKPDPRPAFEDWKRARAAGIDIAPPPAMLRPWRPAIADLDDWCDLPKLAPAGPDALVMACDPEPPAAQALWRAAERADLAPRLFEADRRLAGYGWYDILDRVTAIATEVSADGAWQSLDEVPLPEMTGAPEAPLPHRPAAIRFTLAVKPAVGPRRTLAIPADLAFAGEPWGWLADALPLVTADSALQPHELALLLRAGFFSPSDDADADSWETQRDRFDQEAQHISMRLLASEDDARIASIAEAVRRELFWLVPRDRPVDIHIHKPEVTVTLSAGEGTT